MMLRHAVRRARNRGLPIAIGSNNSVSAVEAFLDREGLAAQIAYTSARSAVDPSLMKPNPHLLDQAPRLGPLFGGRS